jgi:hypothetical protein
VDAGAGGGSRWLIACARAVVGELRDWIDARLADGTLDPRSKLSVPDLYGSSAGLGVEIMVTHDGIACEMNDPPNLLQAWGVMR